MSYEGGIQTTRYAFLNVEDYIETFGSYRYLRNDGEWFGDTETYVDINGVEVLYNWIWGTNQQRWT